MDEDKPEHSQSHDPAEESQHADSSLVSKLARAYSSLPPEQRGAGALPDSTDLVSNPELEDRFQKLLKQVEGRRDLKPDPRVVARLEKKIQKLRVGAELSDDSASSKAAPAEGVSSAVPSSVQCARCGQSNSAPTPFCGMCGAELAKSSGASDKGAAPAANAGATRRQPEVPMFAVERETGGRRGFKIAVLVLALAALAVLVSQQWPWWRQPFFRANWIARSFNAPPAPSPAMSTARAPAGRPASPPVSVRGPQPLPSAPEPGNPVHNTPRKPAPPTTVKRRLPGPVPLASALPEMEVPSSPQPETEASQPPQRTRLLSAVAQGGLIYKADPEYPPVARMARVQGSVVLHAIIGQDGTVQQLRVVSGNPLLAGSALNAVKNWRYRPYLVDGEGVEVETTITVNFKGED